MANNNISFVDIAVSANVPIEAPELWTTSMYIGLFMGGLLVRGNDIFNCVDDPDASGTKAGWPLSRGGCSDNTVLG